MALALVAALVAAPALAYVLPAGSILRRLVEARNEVGLVSLRVDGSLTLSGAALQQAAGTLGLPVDRPEAQTDATLFLKVPGRCRLEAGVAEGARVGAVVNGGRRKAVGVELAPLTRGLTEVCALLALRASSVQEGREMLESHLRTLGVDVARGSSLARFGGKVAYVLGGRGEGAGQLWVYKDSFQPARLRWKDKDGTAWDVWMLDYASPATGEAFPRILEVYQNGERQLRFTALRADPRARVDDPLFAIP